MIHLLLLLVCILSVEVFIKLNFLSLLDSILEVIKKVIYVISKNNISDHWKEKVVPAYALKMMKYSFQILLILFVIIFFFVIADFLINNFLAFTLSLMGILESAIFAFGYAYLRKLLIQ
jgi:preprotein translocase subunit SecE|tara:strand:+ start:879 stop:1235 length:357 start_codon:yes stop_codon:yes gene_type:complete